MSPRWEPNPDIRRGRSVVYALHAELREFNGERDHVHLLGHYPPKVAISRLAGSLKRKYSRGEHFWSPSHFAASCGGARLAVIKEYIENQKRPG
ncbi:IS200/IS605 family transposase [Streptomyces sp. NPDC001286]